MAQALWMTAFGWSVFIALASLFFTIPAAEAKDGEDSQIVARVNRALERVWGIDDANEGE
jgi:hypothetical protein